MCNPNTDAGDASELFRAFYDELDENSDIEDGGDGDEQAVHDLPADEQHALCLLKDLEAQAHVMQQFEKLHAGCEIGAHGSASAENSMEAVSAESGQVCETEMAPTKETVIEDILSSESLAGVSAEDAQLITKLAYRRGVSVSYCFEYRLHSCIACVAMLWDRICRSILYMGRCENASR